MDHQHLVFPQDGVYVRRRDLDENDVSQWIIKVENASKRYRIRHAGEKRRYVTLREVVTDRFRRLLQPAPAVPSTMQLLWALKDVSLEVSPGEVVGIIGRNGAGKSTLLKLLSRITVPTLGRVRLRGRVSSLLEVGTGFHPELTGRENIYLNGAILGMRKKELDRKVDAILDFAGVEEFADTPVKRFSSGMHVRLAFAVAAHLEPEILIIDEVLAVGDAPFQRKCLEKMREIAAKERAILFVSHNLAAVEELCTRAILLRSGSIEAEGAVAEITARYLNAPADPQAGVDAHVARSSDGRAVLV